MLGSSKIPIHRVVTCFILTQQQSRIAIFHRCKTMPTFPNFFAGISGTIEETDKSPFHAAKRELREETNLSQVPTEQGGLYVNVRYVSKRNNEERIIRVYPLVVHVPEDTDKILELRGTEHDRYQFVSISQLDSMESECVPGLSQAFHHATFGIYDKSISDKIRDWAKDKGNGASVMTQNALKLIQSEEKNSSKVVAQQIAMLRPSMAPIVNVMQEIIDNGKDAVTVESFLVELERSVQMGIQNLHAFQAERRDRTLTIATFSRSGTLSKILKPFVQTCTILCGQSTPGNEGELMAQDLNVQWISDTELETQLASGKIDVLLIGSDCILPDQVVNKVGTRQLCEIAKKNKIPVFCCADRWKIWDDIFPPPLEDDLFELVPLELVTKLLVPHQQ